MMRVTEDKKSNGRDGEAKEEKGKGEETKVRAVAVLRFGD